MKSHSPISDVVILAIAGTIFLSSPVLAQSAPADEETRTVSTWKDLGFDDMGWSDFSCFGNTDAQTPNIDRMAREGIAFQQFYDLSSDPGETRDLGDDQPHLMKELVLEGLKEEAKKADNG